MSDHTKVKIAYIAPQNAVRGDALATIGGGPLVARICGFRTGTRILVDVALGIGVVVFSLYCGELNSTLRWHA